jgi:toxin ParE1/3/4
MKVVYLATTRPDVAWVRRYYRSIFPQGGKHAAEQFRRTEQLLMDNPELGRTSELEGLRELQIGRTPFAFVYRVVGDTIEVIRVLDGRSER